MKGQDKMNRQDKMKKQYISPMCLFLSLDGNAILAGSGNPTNVNYDYGEKLGSSGEVKEDNGTRDSEAKRFNAWSCWED
mgnify:CR=1 FL=1